MSGAAPLDPDPPGQLSERIVLRRHFGDLEVVDFEEDEPFDRIVFHRFRRRAWFGDGGPRRRWNVVRRRLLRHEYVLLRGGAVRAVARRRSPFRHDYALRWERRALSLVRRPGGPAWRVLEGERQVGEVKPRPLVEGETDVELPAGTPDEVLVFVGVVIALAARAGFLRGAAEVLERMD